MNVHEWLEYGIEQGFCSVAVCATHEGLPYTDEELDLDEDMYDACVYATRLYPPTDEGDR